jgi:hypothetical protein
MSKPRRLAALLSVVAYLHGWLSAFFFDSQEPHFGWVAGLACVALLFAAVPMLVEV